MRIIIDIEANGLTNPDKIWVIVCKDIDTGKIYVFKPYLEEEASRFRTWLMGEHQFIGHHILGYDIPVICKILDIGDWIVKGAIDTHLISKMISYSRDKHSIESYGEEFNFLKGIPLEDGTTLEAGAIPSHFYLKYSKDLENYCLRDVEITEKIYNKYKKFIEKPEYQDAIRMEHDFEWKVCYALHKNGFAYNKKKAEKYLSSVETDLNKLDKDILNAFPPREVLVREFTPKLTKHGTISRSSVPRSLMNSIHQYEAGKTYRYTKFETFNPASHKQLIDVLWEAGWKPEEKTKTRLDTERELNKLKHQKHREPAVDLRIEECHTKLSKLEKYGWKINEANLATLPSAAPEPARLLARRILLEARRRTLTEQISLCQDDGRVHGKFQGIGAWTHRMSHQNPNMANIPNEFDTAGNKKLLGKEMRSLWCSPKNRLLVGVDAEGIQLRIFAHYIDDVEFTDALVRGKKETKTDPHSFNQRILGKECKSRAAAKHFIYALLLGAGIGKLAEILGCSRDAAQASLDRLMERYTGFTELKKSVIPRDARRGWFLGIDGRPVPIPGDTDGIRRHLCMSGYLQAGEAVVMKRACLKWIDKLKEYDALLVNFVHDEWQTECPNDIKIALEIAKMQADSIKEVGEELKLKCPLAGSYWNDDAKDYTIATNWAYTH